MNSFWGVVIFPRPLKIKLIQILLDEIAFIKPNPWISDVVPAWADIPKNSIIHEQEAYKGYGMN
jgi:hypothetical protein